MNKILITLLALMTAMPAVAKTYDKDYFGETTIHKAVFEDTLIHLARHNELGFVELRAANPELDPWIPGAGAKIILPKKHILPDAPREGIVINLSEMRLFYFKDAGKAPITYPISIGREGLSTPQGTTSIVRKKDGPTWRPTPRMREEDPELPEAVGPGPDNPLGTHAMYLGWPQYLIHGTNKPYGIGRRVSSGCIRMYPESIKALFPQVPVGTKVTVVDQAIKVGWIDDKMFIEVHPNQEQSLAIEENGVLKSYEVTADDMKRITKKAGQYADRIDWEAVRDAVKNHSGFPVAVLDKNKEPGQSVKDELQALLEEAKLEEDEVLQAQEVKAVEAKAPDSHIYEESATPEKPATKPKVNKLNTKPARDTSMTFNN
ncbi:MAG: L,D-transpeptidase family protein [Alphaproteobacteria bacterium]|nr:L,D-transpeptidase family protein [Alphaproteobacteria bacterium]NCQ88708.1 L,D-transpeptidase family protein [Alphaproteobacteria bacterium]NCT08195.1 L,D-transpeptidase family protein [Alphaproteobacteria bacterium]